MAKRRSMRRGIQRVDINLYGDEFLAIVERYGDEAMFAAGQIVLAEAGRRAPRATGKLAQSGYVSTRSKSTYKRRAFWRKEKTPPKNGATIGFTAPHAHLMESGRRKRGVIRPRKGSGKKALRINGSVRASSKFNRMSSRPFLGPALEATQQTMAEELAQVLKRRLEREGRK